MKNIVGIRFKKPGKIYFFDPGDIELEIGDFAIVDTANGQEYAEVAIANNQMPDERVVAPLRKVIRKATNKDIKHYEDNKKKEKEALKTAENKIKEHKLDMNLTDVEYKFDNSKITFFFTADGVCGRELCCCSFLNKFDAVSIKMAKEQNLSLNPSKISGNCGRLMCCLRYEQAAYEDKLSRMPKVGAIVKTADGEGTVEGIETLKEIIKVKFKDGEDSFYKKYKASDVKIIKNIEKQQIDEEEKQNMKELKEIEKLSKQED